MSRDRRRARRFKERTRRQTTYRQGEGGGIDIRTLAVANAVGVVVGEITKRIVFGE